MGYLLYSNWGDLLDIADYFEMHSEKVKTFSEYVTVKSRQSRSDKRTG
jgi:hypothetical protein